jgi:hypothetical protein
MACYDAYPEYYEEFLSIAYLLSESCDGTSLSLSLFAVSFSCDFREIFGSFFSLFLIVF